MCGKNHSIIEMFSMALTEEIEGIEFYTTLLEELPDDHPCAATVKQIIEEEKKHAKFFYAELGKYM